MKNIIVAVCLLILCAYSGCDDEEVISLYESNDTKSVSFDMADSAPNSEVGKASGINAETDGNNDEMAEDDKCSQPFVVFVTGEVEKPGVYELEEGSRCIDAISAAGGYTKDASDTYLNLAGTVEDGQMIYVPSKTEAEALAGDELPGGQNTSGVANNGGGKTSDGRININKATKEELMTLPGIGESKADKIIAYRDANGPFSSPEGVMLISGIKDGLYNKIKDQICVK